MANGQGKTGCGTPSIKRTVNRSRSSVKSKSGSGRTSVNRGRSADPPGVVGPPRGSCVDVAEAQRRAQLRVDRTKQDERSVEETPAPISPTRGCAVDLDDALKRTQMRVAVSCMQPRAKYFLRGSGPGTKTCLPVLLPELQASKADARGSSIGRALSLPALGDGDGVVEESMRSPSSSSSSGAQHGVHDDAPEEDHACGPAASEDTPAAALVSQPAPPPCQKTRICIVGAGPVGLWTCLLLCRKYNSSRSAKLARVMLDKTTFCRLFCPVEIVICEKRGQERHGTRNILLAFSMETERMLFRRISERPIRHFSPSVPLAELEAILLREVQKFPCVTVEWNSERCPTETDGGGLDQGSIAASEFDIVLWANGRNPHSSRHILLNSTSATILSYEKRPLCPSVVTTGNKNNKTGLKNDTSVPATSTASPYSFYKDPYSFGCLRSGNIIIRELGTLGWIWFLGPQSDSSLDATRTYETFAEISPGSMQLECLDQSIAHTGAVRVNHTEATFWGIREELPIVDRSKSALECYVGDSCNGKPFYLGTTLQAHLKDCEFLVDNVDWAPGASKERGLSAYERRMRGRIKTFVRMHESRCKSDVLSPRSPRHGDALPES